MCSSDLLSNADEFLADVPVEWSILYWIDLNRTALLPMRFDCGSEDSLLSGTNVFHNALTTRRVDHEYSVLPGAHSWQYWHNNFVRSLTFFEGILG